MMDEQRTAFLLCYLKTGGGHLAPARSIARVLEHSHAQSIRPVLIDGLAEAAPFARSVIEGGYRMLQARAQWYYELLYALNKITFIGRFNILLTTLCIRPYIRKKIQEEKPAAIVLFHFFLIAPVYQVLRELGLDIPVLTVVTDPFTAHPFWFQRKEQRYIVFSERLRQYCIERRHVAADAIAVFPFILDEQYSAPQPAERIAATRERVGFAPEKKAVLVIGGGDGIPHGQRILEALLASDLDVDIAVVCGKNKQLFRDALRLQQRHPRLKVFAFVDFVCDLINASDIVITKCGASTIMEILLMRKIPIIIDYLWEQELGNMEFVRDGKLGIFERTIANLPGHIQSLVFDEGRYREYQQRIEALHLVNGTGSVAEYIARVCK